MAQVRRWRLVETEAAETTVVLGEAKMMMAEADSVSRGCGRGGVAGSYDEWLCSVACHGYAAGQR